MKKKKINKYIYVSSSALNTIHSIILLFISIIIYLHSQ